MKVVKAEGIKDAAWFAKMHSDTFKELAPGGTERILGLVTDSAPANVSMQILEEEFPHMILIGCQAHALNLLVKDVSGQGSSIKCPWTAEVRLNPPFAMRV